MKFRSSVSRRLPRHATSTASRRPAATRLTLQTLEDRSVPSVTPVGSEFQINSIGSTIAGFSVKAPDVAMDTGGNFVVAWQTETVPGILYQGSCWSDVHARRFDTTGQPLGEEFNVIDGLMAPGNQGWPSVAMGGAGNFVVVWAEVPGAASQVSEYGATSIWARQFDAFGHALGEPLLVDSGATLVDSGIGGITGISVAADAAGNFVVVYSKWEGSTHGIYARRYDAAGNAQQAFRVDTFSLGGETVAMNANGEFVVAWHGPDEKGTGVYARKYDADGHSLSGQVSVSIEYDPLHVKPGSGFQGSPSAAINSAGEFVISWGAFNEPDPGFNNYARRFDAAGQPLGDEFRINSSIGWIRSNVEVAMDAAGDLVAAWTSLPPPTFSDYPDAFAQAYTATGEAVGPTEFRVNTSNGAERSANVAMNAAGDFVVTWADQLSPWIRAQRYSGGFNQPPLASAGGPYTVGEGGQVSLDASGSSDPNQAAGALNYQWDFDGDGQYDDATGISPTFSAAGLDGPTARTVGLKVTDNVGAFATTTATVLVTNVAPTALFGTDWPVDEGDPATVRFTAVIEPSSQDVTAGLRYSTAESLAGLANNYNSPQVSSSPVANWHFADDGMYTIYGRVFDKDGGYNTYQTTVTVRNVVPQMTVTGAHGVNEGATYTLTLGAVSDPGSDTL